MGAKRGSTSSGGPTSAGARLLGCENGSGAGRDWVTEGARGEESRAVTPVRGAGAGAVTRDRVVAGGVGPGAGAVRLGAVGAGRVTVPLSEKSSSSRGPMVSLGVLVAGAAVF